MQRSSDQVPTLPTITLTPAAQRSLANWKLSTAGEPELPASASASERTGIHELPPKDLGLDRRWRVSFLLAAAIAAIAASWWSFDDDVTGQLGGALSSSDMNGDREGLASARLSSGSPVLAASGEAARLQEDTLRIMEELQRSQLEERARSASLERDLAAMRGELERQVSTSQRISADAQQFKQAVEAATATLQHERRDAQMLAEELATVRREIETLSAGAAKAIGGNEATIRELGDLRKVLKQLQEQKAIDDEILVREAARMRELEQKVAAQSALPPAEIPAGLPEPLASIERPAPVVAQAAQPMPTSRAQSTAMNNQSTSNASSGATEVTRDISRLMTRASALLRQGDIAAARNVLELAAETEDAAALYALAETFDPAVLKSWNALGTRGDAARARELYAKALVGGVHEASERLTELSRP
jgi:hypothetical protein